MRPILPAPRRACSQTCAMSLGVAMLLLIAMMHAAPAMAQRGSIIEDRAAKKLLAAGDARFEADEKTKALEVWRSVIERYPRSKVRFEAHMRLGDHLLKRERAYDQARGHFEAIATEENRDEDMRAKATLKMGVCFYEARNFGKCFKVMRQVIETYPTSEEINEAYYYIGLGHFKLGHYSRAIEALEKVGTALQKDGSQTKVEAGKRLIVKVEDADLAALEDDDKVLARCRTTQGDDELVECLSVGRNVRIVLGSIVTKLGVPNPGNGVLEVRGDDKITVTYIDKHTADKSFDRPVDREITVVGDAVVLITDGAYSESIRGVVLGKSINLQVTDGDRDLSDEADSLKARIAVLREKTDDEVEAEMAKLKTGAVTDNDIRAGLDGEEPEIDRWVEIDHVEVTLKEAKVERQQSSLVSGLATFQDAPGAPAGVDAAAPAPSPTDAPSPGPDQPRPGQSGPDQPGPGLPNEPALDPGIHTGIFRGEVQLVKASEVVSGDDVLQAMPGFRIRVTYVDAKSTAPESRDRIAAARCVEGNLGGVRVTRSEISDQELRLKTRLQTAGALTNIGNRYKEFGLKDNAKGKYEEALKVCDEIMRDARRLGGRILEETYVQLWKIYFQMDRLELAAAMAQRLQREFPESAFVDDAMLQLADVARKGGDHRRAVGIYSRLVSMKDSQLRGEAQYGIASCYEEMAKKSSAGGGRGSAQLYEKAFVEYKKVFDQFPESGRVGEAVSKMANFYYQKKDYQRAINVFETVLSEHPDAKFLDVILFNYGRCLFRLNRRGEARKQFDQLIGDFPESPLAKDAKRISEALLKAGF